MTRGGRERVAVIDLGSNTARLILLESVPGYAYRLVDEVREVVRLREGMTAEGLSASAVQRAFLTLQFFARFCEAAGAGTIIATATSAVRDAVNGPAFVERAQRELGLPLRILGGETEAYYGVLGALNEWPLDEATVLDVGGGSAQVSQVYGGRFVQGASLPLGALALTDRWVHTDPVETGEYKALRRYVEDQLGSIPWLGAWRAPLVALGGTARNLARIDMERRRLPLPTLHGYRLSRGSVKAGIDAFRKLPLARRREISGLSSDRADIILAGAVVVLSLMDCTGQDELRVSVNGLREGLFFERFWAGRPYPVPGDVRAFAVLNLARIYGYEKRHLDHVRGLARALFNGLAPIHDYGLEERALLDAACALHDVGAIISYRDQQRFSEEIILSSGLPGHTPREQALIALLARSHRKRKPDPGPYKTLLQPGDDMLLRRLGAILLLARALERGHSGNVREVSVEIDAEALRIMLAASTYPLVELWEAERRAMPLLQAAFGRQVILVTSRQVD